MGHLIKNEMPFPCFCIVETKKLQKTLKLSEISVKSIDKKTKIIKILFFHLS